MSKELELTLTGKDCGLDERAPMCGIPYHAVDGYLNRLVSNGHKVAICEQVEESEAGQRPGEKGSHQDCDPGYQYERPGSG